jgi:hypothetical protein
VTTDPVTSCVPPQQKGPSVASHLPRRTAGILSSLLLAVVAVSGFAAPAHAEDGYQYWNYFHLQDGSWTFSEVGAADYTPKDGEVEGLRYGTSVGTEGIEPRADLDEVNFDTVCANEEAGSGEKRVAVVLDFGTDTGNGTPPEPRAECAVVAQDASTQQVLDQLADLRADSGLVCGIDGYPADGCGEPVKNAEVPAQEETVAFTMPASADDSGTSDAAATEDGGSDVPWGLVGVGSAVVVLAGGGFVLSRRNKAA